ncbi:Putative ribonuclease H protein At1g65750, partial [Linum perenne]
VVAASERDHQAINTPPQRVRVGNGLDPGPEDWVSLNTDGSADQARRKAAAGGLLRDHTGKCLFAYSMNLGSCSITRAEMRGAIEGLRRAWEAGHRKVILRMDSTAAISLLSREEEFTHQHGMEAIQFQDLCQKDWEVIVKHTYREGNHASNYLASIGYDYPIGSHTVSISDCNLGYFLRLDLLGIEEPRMVLIND